MAEPVLSCAGLRKTFGDRVAVNGVGFTIEAGETYGLLGPNGAGKTTSISMICGLLTRDAGEVLLEGRPLDTKTVEVKSQIGYVPQELAIYPDLTTAENLRFFGKLYGLRGAQLAARVAETLDTIGLTDRADEKTQGFSGGMKRRLNIGLGLLNHPKLLVLDEPTVGVDPQSRNAILDSVARFSTLGMAVLYTTHYMEEAERLCDRVGIIDGGDLKAEGTRRELVAMVGEHDRVRMGVRGDATPAVAALRSMSSVVDASASDGAIDLLVRDARRSLAEIVQTAAGAGAEIGTVEVQEPNLEAVFLHLTGRALRDEG